MAQERKNEVTFKGNPLTLLGKLPEIGKKAPDFTVLTTSLQEKHLKDYLGKALLISVVPSLDTGVCDLQTRRFNKEAQALGPSVQILTISCDLPFAQERWCGAAGVEALVTLSDHRDVSFGMNYGVLIKELRLLARSLFIIDKDGILRYGDVIKEMTNEPDYTNALVALKKAL